VHFCTKAEGRDKNNKGKKETAVVKKNGEKGVKQGPAEDTKLFLFVDMREKGERHQKRYPQKGAMQKIQGAAGVVLSSCVSGGWGWTAKGTCSPGRQSKVAGELNETRPVSVKKKHGESRQRASFGGSSAR